VFGKIGLAASLAVTASVMIDLDPQDAVSACTHRCDNGGKNEAVFSLGHGGFAAVIFSIAMDLATQSFAS